MMSKLIILVVNLFCLFSASVGIQEAGQCDQTIQAVTPFNLQNFGGVWYDIASYANTHQSGTCNTATYTVNNDGSMTILNSQVVNQALTTASGTATRLATETSAKFQVLIGSSTTPIDYWVLSTDYDSFALMYSCRNVNANTREVFSWKLSRTRALTAAAETAINAVIASVAALNQQNYVQRDHTPNGCFYYPVYEQLPDTIELPGACEAITGVAGFNAAAYLGTWYEIARYPQPTQQGQCNRANYADAGNGVVSVLNSQVLNDALATISGQAEVTSTDGTGKLQVTFVIGGVPTNTDLYVLATDYLNYALVYSCADLANGNRRVGSWKLSRTRTLSSQALTVMDSVISSVQALNENYYQPTSQSDASCFYYPEFDGTEQTIDLPGACETASITGVPNFNAPAYLGTWYEIARYPQPTQQGQCNRANYADAGNGVVSVLNSQVLNQALATISGQASVTSTDGTGKLQVTFVIGGVATDTDLYVLATDYTSYSLVYSCTNLPDGNRRVGSWKLSRDRSGLTVQANTAINTVVSNTQGLKEEYYRSTSQSNASCFYYPEFDTLPATIELPGPCPAIVGVSAFNANAYLGSWYEIARYPQPTQQGQCNRATYADAGNGIVSVLNRQVVNQALATISGQAAVTSTDGTGKLQVTFDIGGVPTNTDLYVLATDYTSYSLVYSCTDLPNGNRQVGSWKLSRSTTLTQQANAAINTVVTNTEGLREEYYQATSQSDESCFYYPAELTNNEVILPGQCNQTITGVASFNVSAFARTWYHIQRYDSVQGRSCSGTRLTYNEEEGSLDVVDFEVVGEELVTSEGSAKLSSTDGTGRLTLVMGENSEETIIHILGTDYNGYAVAYTCANVDATQRRVRAWQLSHERTMPAAGVTAINALIQNTLELHTPYFNQVTHNEDCQEPSSAVLFKSSIIVIFVCAMLQMLW